MSTAPAAAPSRTDSTGTRSVTISPSITGLATWCLTAAVSLWTISASAQSSGDTGSFATLRGSTDAGSQTDDEAAFEAATQIAGDELGQVPDAAPVDEAEADPYAPLGLRIGAFRIFPAIEAFLSHASNVFSSATDPQSGGYYRVAPELEVTSDWVRHELRGFVAVDHESFFDYSGETTTAIDAELEGRLDISARDVAGLRLAYAVVPESRGDPNVPQSVIEPPDSEEAVAEGTYAHRFGRLEVSLRGAYEKFTYDSAVLTDGTIVDNSDRDYTEVNGAVRASVDIDEGSRAVFFETGANKRKYRRSIDDDGVRRGSSGYDFLVGVSFDRGDPLSGEIAVGYQRQKPVDPSLKEIDSIAFRGSLVWQPTQLTTVTFDGSIEPTETTLDPTASGALVYAADIGVEHALRHNLIASANFAYALSDYIGSGREETDYVVSAGLKYLVSRWLSFQLDASYQAYETNLPGQNYDDTRVELGMRLQR